MEPADCFAGLGSLQAFTARKENHDDARDHRELWCRHTCRVICFPTVGQHPGQFRHPPFKANRTATLAGWRGSSAGQGAVGLS